jgi:uncharacterized protein (DUF1330 family)
MPANVIVQIDVKDPEAYEEHKALAPPSIERHGGRYIVRGGPVESLEGSWMPRRFVILEFPDAMAARAAGSEMILVGTALALGATGLALLVAPDEVLAHVVGEDESPPVAVLTQLLGAAPRRGRKAPSPSGRGARHARRRFPARRRRPDPPMPGSSLGEPAERERPLVFLPDGDGADLGSVLEHYAVRDPVGVMNHGHGEVHGARGALAVDLDFGAAAGGKEASRCAHVVGLGAIGVAPGLVVAGELLGHGGLRNGRLHRQIETPPIGGVQSGASQRRVSS